MARPGVTREDVAEAMATIRERGQHPSLMAIRREMGDTGSLKTISDHVHALREIDPEATDPAETPREVLDLAEQLAAKAWQISQDNATQDLKELRASMKSQVDRLQRELDESIDAADSFEERYSATRTQLATTAAENEALKLSEAKLQTALISLREQYDTLLARFDQQAATVELLAKSINKPARKRPTKATTNNSK